MPNQPKSQAKSSAEDLLSSRMWRRRVREQIMLRKGLSSIASVTGYSIADLLHDTSTTSGDDTIARHVALKQYEAAAGLKELVKKGQARIQRRDNGTRDIFLILRPDVDIEYLPPIGARHGGDKSFYKAGAYRDFIEDRGRLVDRMMADGNLTATDKRIGFAATRFLNINDWTIEESIERIGEVVGLSKSTGQRSMRKLIGLGYFEVTSVPSKRNILTARPVIEGGQQGGQEGGQPNPTYADEMGVSRPISGDSVIPVNLPSNRRLRSGGAEHTEKDSGGKVTFDWATWARFDSVYVILCDYSHGSEQKTIAGVVHVSQRDDNCFEPVDFSNVHEFVCAGLLSQKGDHVSIT